MQYNSHAHHQDDGTHFFFHLFSELNINNLVLFRKCRIKDLDIRVYRVDGIRQLPAGTL